MATNKKGLNLKLILTACAILLAVVTIILLAAPGMAPNDTAKKLGAGAHSLATVTFGNKDKALAFSFLIFLPYVLLLAGIVLNVISLLGKGGKLLPIIATVCYVVGGVLFFLVMQTYCVYTGDLTGEAKETAINITKKAIEATYTLGLGAIFSGILSLVCGGLSLATIFVKKK